MDAVYELLVKARDVFAEKGGAKRVLEDDDTHQVCAMGAINIALTGVATNPQYAENVVMESWAKAITLLNNYLGLRYSNSVVQFNNYYSTTKDDVLALFDKVIAEREEKVT